MGRMSFLNKHGLTLEQLSREYEKVPSSSALAKQFGCSDRTIRRYLTQAGIVRKRGPKKQLDVGASGDRGCLGSYIRKHPITELPHSIREISELTGCTKDEVKCYLYRKRKEMREFLASLPPLDEVKIVLPTLQGFKVPTKAFSAYKLYLNRWKFTVKIVAWLKMGGKKVTIEVTPAFLRRRLRSSLAEALADKETP